MFNLAFVAQTAKELWACQFEFELQALCQAPSPSSSMYHRAPSQGLALQAELYFREHLTYERIHSWFEFEQHYSALYFITMLLNCFHNFPCATTRL